MPPPPVVHPPGTDPAGRRGQDYDVLLTPTLAELTPRIGHLDPTADQQIIKGWWIGRRSPRCRTRPGNRRLTADGTVRQWHAHGSDVQCGARDGTPTTRTFAYELEQALPWAPHSGRRRADGLNLRADAFQHAVVIIEQMLGNRRAPSSLATRADQAGMGVVSHGRGQQVAAQHAGPRRFRRFRRVGPSRTGSFGFGRSGDEAVGPLAVDAGRHATDLAERLKQLVADPRVLVRLDGGRGVNVARMMLSGPADGSVPRRLPDRRR